MSAKVFLGSVLVSLMIMAPVTYFVLPLLYPSMKEDTVDDSTGVVQSLYVEFDQDAWIVDSTNTFELINQTEVTVTTQGDSSLAILYVMQTVLAIDPLMTGNLQVEVALVVEGEGNKTVKVAFFDTVVHGVYRELPADVTINYVTDTISAGNYTVGLYWRFVHDSVGVNFMIAYNPPNYMYARTLWIQEIV